MRHPVAASLACLVAPTTRADAATCIPAGTNYTPASSSQIADGPACHTTPDTSATPVLAEVDETKTAADLAEVVNSSPLDPDRYLGTGSFVQRDISAAPLAANSERIAAFGDGPLPDLYLNEDWRRRLKTGASIGGGAASHDNIPIYTVDSSNPFQDYATFASTDSRVTTFPRLTEVTTGSKPGYTPASTSSSKTARSRSNGSLTLPGSLSTSTKLSTGPVEAPRAIPVR